MSVFFLTKPSNKSTENAQLAHNCCLLAVVALFIRLLIFFIFLASFVEINWIARCVYAVNRSVWKWRNYLKFKSVFFSTVIFYARITFSHQRITFHRRVCVRTFLCLFIKRKDLLSTNIKWKASALHAHTHAITVHKYDIPVKVELVKMRTIFELTGGRDSSDPAKIKSTVRSSMLLLLFSLTDFLF